MSSVPTSFRFCLVKAKDASRVSRDEEIGPFAVNDFVKNWFACCWGGALLLISSYSFT
jgi:hypothetical protein